MPSVIVVTDPVLRVRTVSGTARVGLHELLHLAHTESLIDLSGVRADQRAPVVTALAIISQLIVRYSPSVPATADDWRDALVAQFGDCLTLVGGPDNKPQFFQPVIDMTLAEPFTITEMDHLMPAMRHALKAVAEASPEEGLYALMSSTWRHHGGVGHHAGARARLLTVLVGDGLTIGSEIVSLSAAYAAMRRDPSLVKKWLTTKFPKIKKAAETLGADIYFGDAAHIRSDKAALIPMYSSSF